MLRLRLMTESELLHDWRQVRSLYRRPLRRAAGKLADWLYAVYARLNCYDEGHRFDGCAACSNCGKAMEDADPNYYDRDR